MDYLKLGNFSPQQTPLRGQVADFLKNLILSGDLKPGDRIVERRLAKSLGVGQATVREALQVLEHEGLVFKKANTASFVTQLGEKTVAEIVDIRMELEPKAFVLAQRRMTAATLNELADLISRIDAGIRENDYYGVSRTDLNFHQKVWSIAQNETLEKILARLCIPLFAYLMIMLSTSRSDLRDRVKSHQVLMDQLKRADEPALVQAVREHLWNAWLPFLPAEMQATYWSPSSWNLPFGSAKIKEDVI